MKKIFISYADDNMAYSLKRIGRNARKLRIFDEILLYTPEKLPDYIKSSSLMKYKRGGGYWAWKPAIIWETLQKYEEGTIVIYTDAGCSLYKTNEWSYYFDILKQKNIICFEYKNEMPEWEKFGQVSTKIKYWTKSNTINFFNNILGDGYSERFNKIWGGAILCKGKDNQFIKHWLDITLQYPNLIIDPTEEELKTENYFLAFHKHDQAVITPLAHLYDDVLILEETAETSTQAAIVASRIRVKKYRDYIIYTIKLKIYSFMGENVYNTLKGRLKKMFDK
ncbi:hypothetical protein BAZ12_20070 [Elizabethkingia miricola]|uniref:Uncharacterized protein n=2 Tax=Elizabethkingia miricola TaxID=172045 RepID=A0ABD4DIG2_ELIMR|nr:MULTISPECIES: hypothetical protein [Elizabethkingia]KUY16964.1 hypothetical protein ATB95_11290 [Elizabethkingia miricola]MCL1680502.1 hypothetical protein [Elizabethkingia miricola]OPC72486.1 hypothetical protein BAZ13_07250 [Elizabethkingia miricola]OPC76304.1 hypothetical protein BAZ12_20070 [Elizabethkingia miricola]QCO47529.1 hypothetical protein FCS00_14555 [Elizabethkingia sp. 2-6]